MKRFTIELSDESVKLFEEYIRFMDEDPDNSIKTVGEAIRALATVRVKDRLEQMRRLEKDNPAGCFEDMI